MMWIIIAAISGFLTVIFGAAGDHVLHLKYGSQAYFIYITAVKYQAWHSLALLGIGFYCAASTNSLGKKLLHTAGLLFSLGIILFSFAIYTHIMTHMPFFAYAVPVGGFAFLLGWIVLLVFGIVIRKNKNHA